MTNAQTLYDGISKAAWAYFFLYFDINLETVSILPSFVGYLLFLSAIRHLEEDERELSLLRPLAILLTLWHAAQWLASWGALDLASTLPLIDGIASLINLYFHFQLLTNLATIAAKHQSDGYEQDAKLLRYRTLQTVMLTAILIVTYLSPWLAEAWMILSVVMMIVYIIAGICLMKALFDLRRCLRTDRELL